MLTEDEWAAARRNTINAHYTDADLVRSVWDAVRGLTPRPRRRLRFLEPGSGSGNFIGLAPTLMPVQMTGVEVEPTTAAISRYLYPDAEIITSGLEAVPLADGGFDGVIGNVPYGRYKRFDKVHNADLKLSIHNHFVLKSLYATRPGGIVALITSRYTLDGEDPEPRERMYQLGDLVGAVRLPARAHAVAAGTDVVTDVLFLRRRMEGEEPGDASWLTATKRVLPGHENELAVNTYFDAHPEYVLGELRAGSREWGPEVTVVGRTDQTPAESLAAAAAAITVEAQAAGLTAAADQRTEPVQTIVAGGTEDALGLDSEGNPTIIENGRPVPLDVHPDQREQLLKLIRLKNLTLALYEGEAATPEPGETPQLARLRAELRVGWRDYRKRHPPLTKPRQHYKFTPAEARARATEQGLKDVPEGWKARTAFAYIDDDPDASLLFGLEEWDESAGKGIEQKVLLSRVLEPRRLPVRATSHEDAIALAMEYDGGRLEMARVASLLGTDEETAAAQIADAGLAYRDPEQEGEVWEPSHRYLSGNVRTKLAAARARVTDDPTFMGNVAALERVQPTDLAPSEIKAKIGAPWIPVDVYNDFLAHLGFEDASVLHAGGTVWEVRGAKNGDLARKEWGTGPRPTQDLFTSLLRQTESTLQVTYRDHEGRTYVDRDATDEAQEKAKLIAEAFDDWVWNDEPRAARLAKLYNEMFNNLVLPDYSGAALTLPGLIKGWNMREHQNAAIRRIVHEPTALLAHVVGAGKTATMAAGAMELRRTGLAQKPALVVPNHMLKQWSREFRQLYPNAKILAISASDLNVKRRAKFMGRIAGGEWDAVILTHDAFNRVPLRPENMRNYLDQEMKSLREQLDIAAQAGMGRNTVKQIEESLANAEAKLEQQIESMGDENGVYLEDTGVDYLFLDEAHEYKNLRTVSAIPGAAIQGSAKATKLHMVLSWLRETNESDRVATLATGTPIANSVTEAYVLKRYLAPRLLDEMGLHAFDNWAATFGEVVSNLEPDPKGDGYKYKARFSRFFNVPELMAAYRTFADVQMAEDLNLPTPPVRLNEDGQRGETVLIPPTPAQREFIKQLPHKPWVRKPGGVLKALGEGLRASVDLDLVDATDALRSLGINPNRFMSIDPMTGEAAIDYEKVAELADAAATDMRSVGGSKDMGSKVPYAAEKITEIWQETKDIVYPVSSDDRAPQELPGGLQLVFLDEGTPGSTARHGADLYADLRDELVARGMPRESIRFIHEAGTDRKKEKLFADCRSGRVRVLVGSTQKMGTGTNIQDRAVALHHLSYPWRPADMAQRDGRIERRGNLNAPWIENTPDDVRVLYYITERTFDEFRLTTLARKARFIGQIQRRDFSMREIEDIGADALNIGMLAALASGDPAILQLAEATAERSRLQGLARSWDRTQDGRSQQLKDIDDFLGRADFALERMREAAPNRRPTSGDAFAMTVDDATYRSRDAAANALGARMAAIAGDQSVRPGQRIPVGTLGGQDFHAEIAYGSSGKRQLRLRFAWGHVVPIGQREDRAQWQASTVTPSNGKGAIQSLEHFLNHLDGDLEKLENSAASQRGRREEIAANLRSKDDNPYRIQARSKERQERALGKLVVANEKEAALAERVEREAAAHAAAGEGDEDAHGEAGEGDEGEEENEELTKLREQIAALRKIITDEDEVQAQAQGLVQPDRGDDAPEPASGDQPTEPSAATSTTAATSGGPGGEDGAATETPANDDNQQETSTGPQEQPDTGQLGVDASTSPEGQDTPAPAAPEAAAEPQPSTGAGPEEQNTSAEETPAAGGDGSNIDAQQVPAQEEQTPREAVPEGYQPFTDDSVLLMPGDVVREGWRQYMEDRQLRYRTVTIIEGPDSYDGYYISRHPGGGSTRIHPRDIVAVPDGSRLLSGHTPPAPEEGPAPAEAEPETPETEPLQTEPLQELIDALGDRGSLTHIGGSQPESESTAEEPDTPVTAEAEETAQGPQETTPAAETSPSETVPLGAAQISGTTTEPGSDPVTETDASLGGAAPTLGSGTNEPQPAPSADTGTDAPAPVTDDDAPNGEPDEEAEASDEEAADSESAADDVTIVQTPDGPGRVIGTDGGLVLVSTQSGTRVYEGGEVQWPEGTARPEDGEFAAKRRQNEADLAQASTAEGIELRYGDGNRLVDLDVEAGHGTVVDTDGAVIGWVRARLGDDGRRHWWGQDARGGAPHDMTFHESLPPSAGVPAIRAAGGVRSDLHAVKEPAHRSPIPAEYASREVRLTTAQVRELRRLTLDSTYPDGTPIEPPEWVAAHRKYQLNVAQMQALGDAAQAAADAFPGVTTEERRTAKVLRNAAERFEFEVYDTARWRATIAPIGESDPHAGPYQPRPRTEAAPESETTPAAPAPSLEPAPAVTNAVAPAAESEPDLEPAAQNQTSVPPAAADAAPIPEQQAPPVDRDLPIVLATPPTSLADEPESRQASEQRFGGPDRLLHYAGRAAVVPAAPHWSSVWLEDRLIGYVTDLNRTAGAAHDESWPPEMRRPSGPRFESRPVFGHRDSVSALLQSKDAAVAELVARALQHPVTGDGIDADMRFTLNSALGVLHVPTRVPDERPETTDRLATLQKTVRSLAEGRVTGEDVADDLAAVFDGLTWATDLDGVDVGARHYMEKAAAEMAEYLAAVRPGDTRAWIPNFTNETAVAEETANDTTAPFPEGPPPAPSEQLDLFPSEVPETAAPARPGRRRGMSKKEPATPPGIEGAEGGRLGVYGHAEQGECDRCGTDVERYTVVWHWYAEDHGEMAAECAPCVELTTGLSYSEIVRHADVAESRRGGLRVLPSPFWEGEDPTVRRTADNEWTSVHLPTGKRYRTAKEAESGYRGYVTRDLHGISYGVGPGVSAAAEITLRAALGHTAETHPNDGDNWVFFGYRQDAKKVLLHDGEALVSHTNRARHDAPYEHGPRWDLTVAGDAYVVEMVYQQGQPGNDGHRLDVTSSDGTTARHVQWDGVLEWAREHARGVEAAPASTLTQTPPAVTEEAPAESQAPAAERNGWGLVDGEKITYTGHWDGRYELTLPGTSYLIFQPSLEYRRTKFAVSLNDQPMGITPKRLRRFDDPDEIMPWVRAHASKQQTGYVFRDGAWIEAPTLQQEPSSEGETTAEDAQLSLLETTETVPAPDPAALQDTDAAAVAEPAPATDPVPAPATEATQDDVPVPDREPVTEQEQEEAVAGEPDPASATTDAPAVDPPAAVVDDARALDVEDPPAPRSYTDVVPLPVDAAYQLHLTGVDGQSPTSGELRYGETTIAAVRLSASGRWFARLTVDGLPADVTNLNGAPQEAAEQGAVMFAAFTGTPYGALPGPAVDNGPLTRVDVLRGELRSAALEHLDTITVAVARVDTDWPQLTQFQVLSARLSDLAAAETDAHGSRQMAANITAVQQAVNAWGGMLPVDPALDERQHLAFPLARLLFDTARMHVRLQATLDAAQAERAALSEQEAAAALSAPAEPAREESVPQTPPTPAAPEPVRGPVVTLGLRAVHDGQLVAEVHTVEASQGLVLPGATSADVAGMPLPATVQVPMLQRAPQQAEHLVSEEETRTWLAEQLVDGPLAQAWRVGAVRETLVAVAADVLRDGMAPSVDEVAAWLVTTAAEQDGLLQAAHAAATAQDFAPTFARAADDLVADGASEFLVWRYLGDPEGNRRLDVLALATPEAYEQLRALPAPADALGPERARTPDIDPPAPNSVAPEDFEMTTPERPSTSEVPQPVSQESADPEMATPARPATPESAEQGTPASADAAAAAEWAQLDAEFQADAVAARDLEDEYERYDGPLGWSQWLDQRNAFETYLAEREEEGAATVGGSDDERAEATAESADSVAEPPESDLYGGGPADYQAREPDSAPKTEPAAPLPGDLPLWIHPERNAGQAEDLSVDVVAGFEAVKEAWDEHVPAENGSGEDLFADVQTDLARLQQMLAEAVTEAEPSPEAPPATPKQSAPAAESTAVAAPPYDEQEAARANSDPQKAAGAVNEALRRTDEHTPALQDLPEWQRLQTVRGAFSNLMRVMKERAGQHFGKLMEDGRVADFVRRTSIRVCERIAGWAQAGADRLRRDDGRGTEQRGALPSADALLRLGDAALEYRGPRGGGNTPPPSAGGAPDVNTIPAMRKMGEALSRPMPGASKRGVSTAAARGRSTTTGKQPVKGAKRSAAGSGEQAGHLRRSGEQQQAKPSQQR
ncbi:DEAD/DEAH box helicase family protein [[Kitasatospora] papulosa]|uniref:DEAD/DEAH box helicase family protein n=1 Tax=[Kitasatospora] papulosa TaxID=1464011 RepID=UPI003625D7DF